MKKVFLTALAAALIFPNLRAQDIAPAVELYRAGMYSEAAARLQGVEGPMSEGYAALCAISMKADAYPDVAQSFLDRWPESVLVPQVEYAWGLNLFDAERFEEAASHLNRITMDDLQEDQVAEFAYKKAYCAFGAGDYERSKQLFVQSYGLPYSDYTAPSSYSLGYINYAQGDFAEASGWFEKAATDPRFTQLANYYILECRFNEKDYQYVVDFGEDLFNKVPEDRQPHMARIMSESYLILGDVEKARSYYQKNLANKAAKTRSDYFYAGSVLYRVEDWQGAIDNFSQMRNRADSLGQIANYQMGYSYIQTRNKVAALTAFKDASDQSYNSDIQEDAYFNYAKLAFDLNGDTAPFADYLDRYHAQGDRIYSYMAMSALQNHDYEAAVAAYDNIDELDPHMQSNYRKAYFLRAMELMESGSYRAAVPHLKAASYYGSRRDPFNQLSRYALAEAYYRDGKYADSRSILTDLYNLSALNGRKEGDLISYQTAYTYFQEGDYSHALKWFQNYLESGSDTCAADAETRIGDCYFFSKDYSTAIVAYERKLADYPDKSDLYPAYRAGVAAGLLRDFDAKVKFLEGVKQADPSVPWYAESLYELGRAYVSVGDEDDAVRAFRTLRSSASDPEYATRALLELGMIARNRGDNATALDYYKQVVDQGGDHTEDALLAIESIYRTRQEPDAYLAYVNGLGGKASRTEAQKEDVYFSTAEQIFLSENWSKATATLQSYLEKYPEGAHRAEAQFYLAESYRMSGDKEKACDAYVAALDGGLDGSFQESARLHYAELSYDLGHYGKAYGSYLALESSARMEANRTAARIGMMRSAYKAREWADAASAAEKLLAASPDAGLEREARYILAKSCLGSSQREKAFAQLEKLALAPSTDEGAEAAYLIIQDQYDRGEFDCIEDRVYDFAAKASGQNYWLAKAFIVLGDAFAEKGNLAQAKATFESIRSGYTPTGASDDVPDQVELRLKKL